MSPPRAREIPGPLPLSVTFIYAPAGLTENPQCSGMHASLEKLQQRSLEKLPPGHPDPRNPKEGQGGGSCVEKGSGGEKVGGRRGRDPETPSGRNQPRPDWVWRPN